MLCSETWTLSPNDKPCRIILTSTTRNSPHIFPCVDEYFILVFYLINLLFLEGTENNETNHPLIKQIIYHACEFFLYEGEIACLYNRNIKPTCFA